PGRQLFRGGDHADVVHINGSPLLVLFSRANVLRSCATRPASAAAPSSGLPRVRERSTLGLDGSNPTGGPVPIWIEPPPGRPRAPCRRDCEFRVRERFLEGFAGSYESAAKHNFLATPDKTNPRKWRQAPSLLRAGRVCSGSKCF